MAYYLIKANQTLEDVCCAVYGSLEYLQKLISENSTITSADIDMNLLYGTSVYYDETIINLNPQEVKTNAPTTAETIKYYKGIESQTIYDVSIQKYGDLENIVKLCFDNNFNMYDGDNVKDIEFKYNTKLITNTLLVQFFNNLATGVSSFSPILIMGKSFDKSFDKSFH